jgi:hypothetical protein
MGDRSDCDLKIWGIVDQNVLQEIKSVLLEYCGCHDSDFDEEFNFEVEIEAMNNGDMPTTLRDLLHDNAVNYSWHWKSGGDFHAGCLIHDAVFDETFECETLNGQIALTVEHIRNEKEISRVLRANEILDLSCVTPIATFSNSHEHVAALAASTAMAAYYQRSAPERTPEP